jgi:putative hemolysin
MIDIFAIGKITGTAVLYGAGSEIGKIGVRELVKRLNSEKQQRTTMYDFKSIYELKSFCEQKGGKFVLGRFEDGSEFAACIFLPKEKEDLY